MKKTALYLPPVLICTLWSSGVFAADHKGQAPFYAGIGVGLLQADIDTDLEGIRDYPGATYTLDDDATGWRLFTGYRLSEPLAVELSYTDLGAIEGDGGVGELIGIDTELESEVVALDLVGRYEVSPELSLLGRVGIYHWSSDSTVTLSALGRPVVSSESDDGTRMGFGLGAQYDFDTFATRLEWQRYNNLGGGADYDLFMLSALYRF